MATPSIQYITQLLEEPFSVSETDAENIESLKQVFPYFLPIRYADAALQQKKRAYSAPMMSSMQLYTGNWLLFAAFLSEATKNKGDKDRVVPKISIKKPEVIEKFPLYDEEFSKEGKLFPEDKGLESFIPKDSIQEEPPVSVHVRYSRPQGELPELADENKINVNYAAPLAEVADSIALSEDQDITARDTFEEPDILVPTTEIEEVQEPATETLMHMDSIEETEMVEEYEAEPTAAFDEIEIEGEETETAREDKTYETQQRQEDEEPMDNTRYIIEQISVPGHNVKAEQKNETAGVSAEEEHVPQMETSQKNEQLIQPIYTDDYFRHQGIEVSNEIPQEIDNVNKAKESAREEDDKSLIVMMSFAEWLQHFKTTNEKEREEREDKKALKTMWQKEKLAAAIEEGNDEIPEKVFEMAVNSITKEENLVSEALAEIYEKQGKYDTAIDMYRKLSLRNPQKNAYFARKIEAILKAK